MTAPLLEFLYQKIEFLPTGSADHVTLLFISGKSVIIRAILIYCGNVPTYFGSPYFNIFSAVLVFVHISSFLSNT